MWHDDRREPINPTGVANESAHVRHLLLVHNHHTIRCVVLVPGYVLIGLFNMWVLELPVQRLRLAARANGARGYCRVQRQLIVRNSVDVSSDNTTS